MTRQAGEVLINAPCKIALPKDLSPLGRRMARDLAEFMARAMGTELAEAILPLAEVDAGRTND